MKKIRICFVMPGCYPLFRPEIQETFGGSEVELYNMALYFSSRQDFQVDFLVGDYGQQPLEIHQNICLHKLKYLRPQATPNPIHKALKIVYLIQTLLFQQSDIYITKTASEILGWLVLVSKWLHGKKVVFRLGSDKDTDLAYWKERSKRLYWLYKLGLFNCDQILCQSDFQQAQLYRSCHLIGKVIKNVFCMESVHTHIKDSILWVSRCMALKRPLLFLEMARRIPGEKFVMIMPVNRESRAYSDERISALSARIAEEARQIPNLTLIGFVPFDEIQSYYNHAKLFVNTSEFEGFPNSFIQACMGKTGILSLKVDPDGFIAKNDLGLCCNDDFEAAVGFIQNLNGSTIYQYGRNAFDYVSKNHDIQKIAPKYVRFFEKLVQNDAKVKMFGDEVPAPAGFRLNLAISAEEWSSKIEYHMKTSRNAATQTNWTKDTQTSQGKDNQINPNKATQINWKNDTQTSHKEDKETFRGKEPKPIGQITANRPKKSRYTAVYRLKTILGDRAQRRENRAL